MVGIIAANLVGCGDSRKEDRDYVDNNDKKVESEDVTPVDIDAKAELSDNKKGIKVNYGPDYEFSLYEQFLGMDPNNIGTVSVVVDDIELTYFDYEKECVGKSYNFDALHEQMKNFSSSSDYKEVEVLFTILEYKGNRTLALKYTNMSIYGEGDDSYTILFISEKDGTLHITHSVSEWARSSAMLTSKGYIYTSGSAGAGEQCITAGFIGEYGEYKEIYTANELYGDWIGAEVGIDEYRTVFETGAIPNIKVNEYMVGDEEILSYDVLEGNAPGEKEQMYLDLMEQNGHVWLTKEEVDAKIGEYIEGNLGVDKDIMSDSYPCGWKTLCDTVDNAKAGCYYLNPEADTDYMFYADEIGFSPTLSDTLKAQLVPVGTSPLTEEGIGALEMEPDPDKFEAEDRIYFVDERTNEKDETFQLYISSQYTTIIVTPDGQAVKTLISPIDFMYGTLPKLIMIDFDGDGEDELGVWEYVLHGTGFTQDTFYIVDKNDKDGTWTGYNLSSYMYVREIAKHFVAVDNGNTIDIYFDEEKVSEIDKQGDDSELDLRGAYNVKIEGNGNEVNVRIIPTFYSEQNPMGIMAGQVYTTFYYDGAGSWRMDSCTYSEEYYD